MNNNHLKIVTDNASMKPQSQPAISSKSSSSGAVTPTSDFVDDSGVSEDNASSVTSSSEQGSSIYRSVRTTPKPFTTSTRERDTDTIDSGDIDDANNNTINKNRLNANHNQGSMTATTITTTTSTPIPSHASSIIQLSPGGSAVIEYKTVSHVTTAQKSSIIPNTLSPLSNNPSPVIVSINNGHTNGTSNVIKTISTQSSSTLHSSTTSTPHTHFHKKYIKAMNALNGSGNDTTMIQTLRTNSNSDAHHSTSSTVVSVGAPTTIYTIPMKTEFR